MAANHVSNLTIKALTFFGTRPHGAAYRHSVGTFSSPYASPYTRRAPVFTAPHF